MCTNMVHQLSKISTRTVQEKDQHADMCGQRADMCTDGQYSWAKITRPVHEKGQHVLCVLNRQPTWAKITLTVHGKGQRAESKDQRADMCTDGQSTDVLCVLTDSHGRLPTWANITRTVHGKGQRADMCTDGQSTDVLYVLTDSHGRLVCADGHPMMSYVLCVLTDTHERPVCTEQTAHMGENHPNS
ncbi:unnamed protein product, partial [Brassica oleracea]